MEKQVNLEQFPTSETAKEMLEMVTKGWYDRSYIGKWLYQVMGVSLDRVKEYYEELPEQFFAESATWGLCYHEQKYGLPVREHASVEERRQAILQKKKVRVPMTPYHMERILERQLSVKAEIADIHDQGTLGLVPEHPNRFVAIIWEEGQNTILDYAAVEAVLDQIKQSHTVYEVEHRQIFVHKVSRYAGAVSSEFVEYEVQAKQINRDVESGGQAGIALVADFMILEDWKSRKEK